MFQTSLGIDIKDESVAFLCLRKTFKGVEPLGQAVYTLEKDTPLRDKISIVSGLTADFIREQSISATDIFLGMPSDKAMIRELTFPLAVKENLGTTLKYEMDKYVPLPSASISFDYQILSEDKKENRLKVLLVVLKQEDLLPYLDFNFLSASGASGLEIERTALANYIDFQSGPIPEKEFSGILYSKDGPDIANLDLSSSGINREELIPAFGLALKGLLKPRVSINLIPPEKRKKPGKAGLYTMIFLGILLIFSGLLWGGSHVAKQRMKAGAQNAELKRLVAESRRFQSLREKIESVEERIDFLDERARNKTSMSDILRELTVVMPETAWVSNLYVSEKGIRLDGYAVSASELIPLLEASPLFTEARFLSTITKGKDGRERFKIGLKLDS